MSYDDNNDDMMESLLSNSSVLITILTALIKQMGGEVRIKDDELMSVTEFDMMGLYYDKEDGSMILRVMTPYSNFGSDPEDDPMVH